MTLLYLFLLFIKEKQKYILIMLSRTDIYISENNHLLFANYYFLSPPATGKTM